MEPSLVTSRFELHEVAEGRRLPSVPVRDAVVARQLGAGQRASAPGEQVGIVMRHGDDVSGELRFSAIEP